MVRLILDFILTTVNVESKSHTNVPYGMFLTRVFIRANCRWIDRANNKHPITTMKTFSALGLKPHALEKEKEDKKKDKKKTLLKRRSMHKRKNINLLVKKRRRNEEKEPFHQPLRR